MNLIHLIWAHRWIIAATTVVDVKSRFRGTVIGILWTVIYPILFLGIYAVIYIMIFHVRAAGYGTEEYVLLVFCGLVPFLGFSEALGNGVGSIIANKGLIKNTLFPIELVPVKAVLSSSVTMGVGLLLLISALWISGVWHMTQLAVPLILLLQLMFSIGLIWLLAAVNVFIQDIGQIVAIFIMFLMLVSPIAYTHEMIPKELMPFMYPNPLYYLIMLYRDALYFGSIRIDMLLIFSAISLVMFLIGGHVFSRLKPLFADHV
ncbi:ABC transporter permease [Paracidovorax citrulli]|uniref:Transport permease protein n=2 Tax=Paracidovorax citrulli TaxID=80869 RepID=A1TKR4_PARC0|nr:ABC transporter permease [Paracidovorax citrulli]ABM31552.1 ABC-2 type transporter [Paracidovorax citrulli AAC00-1]ATG95356.1 ABC transporter [Paracidovorax citrulli]PVY65737.1 lipopolysaccharide transport system permease protein [Paracidovorax citrulli]QCX11469.1 Polysialic acid transport protein KpsM [Paracidovorax citrulli]REG70090.1 lipopolysaccharide transport system permease protein [Paracidovorax citrulli]